MCGIVGFTNHRDKALLEQMLKLVTHRGPDDQGLFSSSKISLGQARLSIIDLSSKGRQPMSSEDKKVTLVFNGEIFNFLELRKELINHGHRFKSKTDTEVVVHGYEEWGLEVIKKLRGFFAFALWDDKKETLFLVRDRIGVKPLYYCQDGKKLFFASEIKAILANSEIKRKVNKEAYHQYLAFQASLGERTLFQEIKKVPPASILSFKNGKLGKEKYWKLKKSKSLLVVNPEKRLEELLLESVKIRLASDVPLGVMLSGGLDSSAIVALMDRLGVKKINTFTVGFGQPDDEFNYARLIAKKYRTNHQEILLKPKDIQKILKKIAWHQDEPLADGGGIATYLAAQAVREKVKVVLIGEGGDELFGGYSWYRLGLPYFKYFPEELKTRIYYYLTTFYNKNKVQNVDQYPFFTNLLNKNKGNLLDKMISYEIENILPNSLCMKVDKMTSAWGLEARAPFLDYRLVEFCFSLGEEDKISLRSNKVLFKKVMSKYLPGEIVNRRKHGFLLPTIKWLNNDLKEFTREVIFDPSSFSQKYFSRKELRDLFIKKSYLSELERVNLLWRLLIFELWYKIYT